MRFHEQHLLPLYITFFNDAILPHLELRGYKLEAKRQLAAQCTNLLIQTGLGGKVVADDRDGKLPGVKLRTQVWDSIIRAGFADVCKGSQESGYNTRYRATSKLLELRGLWELQLLLDTQLARNTERPTDPTHLALVHLHTGRTDLATGTPLPEDLQKKSISFFDYIMEYGQRDETGQVAPRAIKNSMAFWRHTEDRIEYINQRNLEHSWVAYLTDPESGRKVAFQPNPCLRQIHVGKFFRACRLYSWSALSGQNLSKQQRQEMLIDGQPTAELDYSGMATRMLYHYAGLDPEGDIYQPERVFPVFYEKGNPTDEQKAVVRDFVKQATNICWNVDTREKAHSSIAHVLSEHPKRDALHGVMNVWDHVTVQDIVSRLMTIHAPIDDRFFSGFGVQLMTVDGQIMKGVLASLAEDNIPALGIHDAVVVRRADVDRAHEVMVEQYERMMLHEPVITRVF
ncbi:hypothetical protein [Aeoliella sp.]|uniref:hypothetical protein n=1 Tax=Aeoliella sp. TaxID=2795800 RepID=UPI003CCC1F90